MKTLWIVATLCLGMATTAQAETRCSDDTRRGLQWLNKMSMAWEQQNYRGVITLQRGDDMQVMQVVHNAHDNAANEVMTALTGRGNSIKRIEHPLNCVHPGQQLLRAIDDVDNGECGIGEHYSLLLTPGERVAGRETVYLHIKPKDVYRYGHLMALDKQTGLLLKAQTMTLSGRALERFQFASVQMNDSTADVDGVQQNDALAAHFAPPSPARTAHPAWAPRWLPEGFVPTDMPEHEARLTYTDGLAVFSLFVEEVAEPRLPSEGVVRLGSTISYVRGVNLGDKGILLTVVGEVPVNTARMVADSVVRR